jgi:hypothetical protein
MFVAIKPTNGGIKSTDKLNHLHKEILRDSFSKFIDKSKSGFWIDLDARWAQHIYFNNKPGFIVLKEQYDDIQVWIYSFDNDLEPTYYILDNYKTSQSKKLINFIKQMFRQHIQ